MDRYICIHAHFYQPPRENAWLEFVELQDSAYPFHDWNERITAECYAPNGTSRILDGYRSIVKITNNYAHISFNFGPTLLAWLADEEPETYRAILEADKEASSSSPVTVPQSLRLTITRYFHFQTPATNTLKSFGGFAILNFGLDAGPKECGCPRLRLILKCSTYLPASTSGSPYCRRIRRNARANCDAAPGVMQAAAVSILPCRIA